MTGRREGRIVAWFGKLSWKWSGCAPAAGLDLYAEQDVQEGRNDSTDGRRATPGEPGSVMTIAAARKQS